MTLRFFDRQNVDNSLNGAMISDPARLREILTNTEGRAPFFAELISESGFKLLLGLGGREGCAQFSAASGAAPYYMATIRNNEGLEGEMTFLIGDSKSPVPKQYCIPNTTLTAIAEQFLESGNRPDTVEWREI
jgi:Immunity protein Imm1